MAKARYRTKRAISSGGVLYRRTDGKVEVVLIAPSGGDVWALPKGGLQPGESPAEAAKREVQEETGVEGEIVEKIGDIDYWYASREAKARFFKTVHFYLLRYLAGTTDQHDWEVREARWFPVEEAEGILTYENERNIMRRAADLIAKVEAEASQTTKAYGSAASDPP